MTKKVPKTVYFTEEIEQRLQARAKLMDRTFSAEVERLIKKALKGEEQADMEAVTAG